MKRLLLLSVMFAVCFAAQAQKRQAAEPPPAAPPPAYAAAPPPPANNNSNGTASPEEVCRAVITFLNEQLKGGYDSFIGSLYSETTDLLTIKKYNSKINFPVAQRTLIEEKNDLQPYRKAEVLMLEQSSTTGEVSEAMKGYYDQINTLFKACLESNKFEYANPGYDPAHLHKSKATFSKKIPDQSNSLFSDLQSGNTLVVEVNIDQDKNKDGSFTNSIYVIFKRQ